jgi:hypothetical protein
MVLLRASVSLWNVAKDINLGSNRLIGKFELHHWPLRMPQHLFHNEHRSITKH